MSYNYTPRKIMQYVDYSDPNKKEFVKQLLRHDYRMISHVLNFDFELVKEHIEKSISFLELADMRKVASHDDMEKIIRHAYGKTRAFKNQLMHFLMHVKASKEEIRDNSYMNPYKRDSKLVDFDVSKISDVLEDMFLYDPTIIFAFNEDYLQSILKSTSNKLIKKINFKKLEKNIMKLMEKYEYTHGKRNNNSDKENNFFQFIGEEKLATNWWGSDELLVSDSDKKIQQLQDLFKDRPEFSSIILLIKLK
jgi:hypothetical protein